MSKIIILCAILTIVITTNAQGMFGFGPSFGQSIGMAQSQAYSNFVVQSSANKLSTPDLPEDLQIQLAEILANSEMGFAACDELLQTSAIFWQYKKCSAFQLRNTLLQIAAIERELTLRNSTTTVAPETSPIA